MVDLGKNNFRPWRVNYKKNVPDWAYIAWTYFSGICPAVIFDGEDIARTISNDRKIDYDLAKKSVDYLLENKIVEIYPWDE